LVYSFFKIIYMWISTRSLIALHRHHLMSQITPWERYPNQELLKFKEMKTKAFSRQVTNLGSQSNLVSNPCCGSCSKHLLWNCMYVMKMNFKRQRLDIANLATGSGSPWAAHYWPFSVMLVLLCTSRAVSGWNCYGQRPMPGEINFQPQDPIWAELAGCLHQYSFSFIPY
jgi:hypothetical protein